MDLERILVRDTRGTVSIPREIRAEMASMGFEKLDRFYRATRVWYVVREKRFEFEDRS